MDLRRYLLIIVLGITPLALLTVHTIVRGFIQQESDAPLEIPESLGTSLVDIERQNHSGAADQIQLLAMTSMVTRPFITSSPIESDPPSEGVANLLAQWQDVRRITELMRNLALEMQLVASIEEAADNAVLQVENNLQKLRAKCDSAKIPGSDEMRTAIDAGLVTIASEQKRREVSVENQALLSRAQSAFSGKQYDACVSMLLKWKGKPTAEVLALQQRAKYFQEAAVLEEKLAVMEKSPPADSWLSTLESARRFLADRGGVDDDLATTARLETLQKRIAVLEAKHYLGTLSPPTDDMQGWAREAKTNLEVFSTPQLEQKIQRMIATCFATGLGEKPDDGKDMQMAVDANGQLLEGYFEPQEDGRWYKYFAMKSKEAARLEPNAWGTKMANSLRQQPVTVPTAQIVRDYAKAKRQLLTEPFGQQRWTEFMAQLKTWQVALDEYRKLGGEVNTSFENEIEFCQQVLDAWTEISSLVSGTTSPE